MKIAFSRFHLPDGRVLHREVVEFGEDGAPVGHYPLLSELPFVVWKDEDYYWKQ